MAVWKDVSKFVYETKLDQLPEDVITQAKWVILDTLGATLGGINLEPVPEMINWGLLESGSGAVTIPGGSQLGDIYKTALITATVALELDEGNALAKGHPCSHILPAALAWAEKNGQNGIELIESIVAAYEVSARIAGACTFIPSVHPHGNWGTIGAALGVAKLRGFNQDEIEQALYISASLALPTTWESCFKGATIRNIYTGLSNCNGILATDFVKAGVIAPAANVEIIFGSILSPSGFNQQRVLEGLGSVYEITRNYFKVFSCCRYNHGPLEALGMLKQEYSFKPEETESILVETYKLAAMLNNQEPGNPFGAKFSIPFAAATYLINGEARKEFFQWEQLEDQDVRSLARKVFVQEDPAFTKATPLKRPCRVTVKLHDGRELKKQVEAPAGGHENPFSKETLKEKFLMLAGPIVGDKQAESIVEMCLNLEQVKNVNDLTRLLRPAVTG